MITNFNAVEIFTNMTVIPQQYTLQCVLSGVDMNFGWYYRNTATNTKFDCSSSSKFGYSCHVSQSQIIYSINSTFYCNLIGMQGRLIVEYLVSQTIMVIM